MSRCMHQLSTVRRLCLNANEERVQRCVLCGPSAGAAANLYNATARVLDFCSAAIGAEAPARLPSYGACNRGRLCARRREAAIPRARERSLVMGGDFALQTAMRQRPPGREALRARSMATYLLGQQQLDRSAV
jgi:hypothetical protein